MKCYVTHRGDAQIQTRQASLVSLENEKKQKETRKSDIYVAHKNIHVAS